MSQKENITIFQLLLRAKAILRNYLTYEISPDQLLSLKEQISSTPFSCDLIVLQLLQKQTFYQQFKNYVWEKIQSLPYPHDLQESLSKTHPQFLSSSNHTLKLIQSKQIIRKIQIVEIETLQIGQELALLQLYQKIDEQKQVLLKKLSLKKMIVFLLKEEASLEEKVFLQPFLAKVIVTEGKIFEIFRSILKLAQNLEKKDIRQKQTHFMENTQIEEMKSSHRELKSSLSSSIEAFLQTRPNSDKEHSKIYEPRKKVQIKTDFTFGNNLNKSNLQKKSRMELISQRSSTCCWRCPI